MMDTLKGLLGDGAEDKIRNAMSVLGGSSRSGSDHDNDQDSDSDSDSGSLPQFDPESMEYIMKIKNMADELSHPNDARSNLLMSLKPYMRDSRRKSIDNAVRILNLTKFSGLFH